MLLIAAIVYSVIIAEVAITFYDCGPVIIFICKWRPFVVVTLLCSDKDEMHMPSSCQHVNVIDYSQHGICKNVDIFTGRCHIPKYGLSKMSKVKDNSDSVNNRMLQFMCCAPSNPRYALNDVLFAN